MEEVPFNPNLYLYFIQKLNIYKKFVNAYIAEIK